MLADLDRDTVDFIDNYDGKYREPLVLPGKFPNLLVNGSDGIAVGMATDIPPHNLREVCDGLIRLIDNPDVSLDRADGDHPRPRLPDRRHHLRPAGHRRRLHAPAAARSPSGPAPRSSRKASRAQIIITRGAVPATRNRLAEEIGELVKDERIKGIARDPRRVERPQRRAGPHRHRPEARRRPAPGPQPALPVLAAAEDGQHHHAGPGRRPAADAALKEMLEEFLDHRVQVIRRRTEYLLREAKRRRHVLEGQLIAISSLDEVIRICRASPNRAEAKAAAARHGGAPRAAGAGARRRGTSPPCSARLGVGRRLPA